MPVAQLDRASASEALWERLSSHELNSENHSNSTLEVEKIFEKISANLAETLRLFSLLSSKSFTAIAPRPQQEGPKEDLAQTENPIGKGVLDDKDVT